RRLSHGMGQARRPQGNPPHLRGAGRGRKRAVQEDHRGGAREVDQGPSRAFPARTDGMGDCLTRVRAENLFLGTLFLFSALVAGLVTLRASGQEPPPKPKATDPAEASPSDKPKPKPAPALLPDGAIRRLGLQPGQPGEPVGHTSAIQSLSFSADGTRLA